MKRRSPCHTRRLILPLSVLLAVGFLITSLASYFVSRASLRAQITSTTLPLTSDNIYSEIQRDLLRPIVVSSLMANDTFLRDWVLGGEKNEREIRKYLHEVMVKNGAFTSFFVSEATRTYYHADGILKRVSQEEERDEWYFRVRKMEAEYETNVDPDMANQDVMTVFINHKVRDYRGNYIGATGVGLATDSVAALIDEYRRKYHCNVYFSDSDGDVLLRGGSSGGDAVNLRDLTGTGANPKALSRPAGIHLFDKRPAS